MSRPPDKWSNPAKILAKGTGNLECVVMEEKWWKLCMTSGPRAAVRVRASLLTLLQVSPQIVTTLYTSHIYLSLILSLFLPVTFSGWFLDSIQKMLWASHPDSVEHFFSISVSPSLSMHCFPDVHTHLSRGLSLDSGPGHVCKFASLALALIQWLLFSMGPQKERKLCKYIHIYTCIDLVYTLMKLCIVNMKNRFIRASCIMWGFSGGSVSK